MIFDLTRKWVVQHILDLHWKQHDIWSLRLRCAIPWKGNVKTDVFKAGHESRSALHSHKLKEKLKEYKIRVFFAELWVSCPDSKKTKETFLLLNLFIGCRACARLFLPGHLTKFLLTEFRQAGWESTWLSVTKQGSRCARSAGHNLEPNIIPSSPPTQLMITYYFISIFVWYY